MSLKLIDLLQFLAQAAEGTVEARLSRPERDAECRRRVGQLEIVTESERKKRSIVGIETADSPRDFVALRELGRRVGFGRRLVEVEWHDAEPLLAPARVDRGVDRDASEPGRPALRVTQSG